MREVKNILVTGGAGFIGSSFIRYLLTLPEFEGNIVNYDLLTYAANTDNIKSVSSCKRYFFIQGDICSQNLVEDLLLDYKIDSIVHFAAETHVDRSIANPSSFFDANIRGTYSLLEALRKMPHIHFHHISTDEVYGSLGEKGFFYENSPYRPSSPYAASKAASDHLVKAYGHTYGLRTTLSHSCNNYGPYQYPEKFIPLLILNALQRKTLPIYGMGRNVRQWIFVEDHSKAVWTILKRGRLGETYDIGGGEEKSNIELLQLLLKIISEEASIEHSLLFSLIKYVKDRPGHDFRYAIDGDKLQKELGWRSEVVLEEGLRKTVRWYLKHANKLFAYR